MKRKASTIAAAAAVAVSVVLGAPPALAAGETVTAADPTCLGNLEGTAPEVTLTYSSPNNAAVFVPSVNGVEDSGQGVPAGGTGGQTLQLSSFAAGTQVRVVVTIEVVGSGALPQGRAARWRLDAVGSPDRVLEIPPDPRVVGWWRDGVGVGASQGTVVLAVHLDSRRYGRGPYAAAGELQQGAPMSLVDMTGSTRNFVVTSVDRYRKAALPYDRIFSQTGAPGVVLVTCGGEYNAAAGGWDSNVVVTFSPV